MSESEPWFRVRSVLRCAFELYTEDQLSTGIPLGLRPASVAARNVVRRIERTDTVLREVGKALIDAIESLEQEVERLRMRLDLAEVGIELQPNLVDLGGDGMTLDKPLPFEAGTRVRVWLELPISGQERVFSAPATVLTSVAGTSLQFTELRAEVRDRIVAYSFQHQAMERRRARDHAR